MSATAEHTSASTAQHDAKTTTLSALKTQSAPEANLPAVIIGFETLAGFEALQRIGKMFSMSTIVPDVFKGNVGNCAIATEMAQRMRASPLMVMQNLDVIYGRPSWRAKFLIGCFNQCGRFEAIGYEWTGTEGKDDWGCRALSRELATNKSIRGPKITIGLAKAEGWYDKKGSKWPTIPELMLMYRAGAWMINTTAPEISLGLPTDDEVRDTYDATRGADGQYSVTTESLRRNDPQLPNRSVGEKSLIDPAEWVRKLNAQADLPELNAVWEQCQHAFEGSAPNECDEAYQNRRESLGEKAGKQLDL